METIAIVAFSAFFAVSFAYLLREDIFLGGVYFFLFVYTIFTQIGYLHFPELSAQLNAYFGPEVFLPYLMFVWLSFVSFLVVVVLLNRATARVSYAVCQSRSSFNGFLLTGLLVAKNAYLLVYLLLNQEALSYASASDQEFIASGGVPYAIFGIAFKWTVPIALILYCAVRLGAKIPTTVPRWMLCSFLVADLLLFAVIASQLGNRTDVLALALGILVFEYAIEERSRGTVVKLLLLSFATVAALVLIESTRVGGGIEDRFLYELIIFKDYFPPSHILLAAIHLELVSPDEVLASNAYNSLVMFGHPYLQATVMEQFTPGVATRSASYAFYVFAEGFLTMGWLGFIYNGTVVAGGVILWRRMASSQHNVYNLLVLALIATQLANIARTQTSYFIKDLYTVFVPAIIVLYLVTGLRPALGWLRAKGERAMAGVKAGTP